MKKFLIQNTDLDFARILIESIRYNNWFYYEPIYDYVISDSYDKEDYSKYIPVGSVEFVLGFLKKYFYINNVLPINVPNELQKMTYLKRKYMIKASTLKETKFFVKSKTKIKGYTDIIKFKDIPSDDDYVVSQVVEIGSEWRAFVYNHQLVGLQNYSGDFTSFPDVLTINNMIDDYNDCPPAYTLDVGVNRLGTFVIEVHAFFSCGLYGFADHKIIPRMFIDTFNYIVENNKPYIRLLGGHSNENNTDK